MPSKLTDYFAGGPPAADRGPSLGGERDSFLLDFERENGNRLALPYTSLLSAELDPSKALVLVFATHVVTLTGVNLRAVYDAIVTRAVGKLIEVGDRADDAAEGVAVVRKMDVAVRQ